jgi:hypothetical protein
MSDYFKRLQIHPGVPIASMLTVMMGLMGGWGGALASLMFWVPVLITARTQPLPKGDSHE